MLKRVAGFLIMASCCTVAALAQTQQANPNQQYIYKWTDDQGMVKYSELAPPTGVKYEMVQKAPGAVQGAEAALNAQQAKERAAIAEQEAKQKEQTEQAQKQMEDARAKNCELAKKNVQALQGDTQVVKSDDKGNKVTLDAEQRAAELKRAQKDAEYFCNP